jgi:shikimate dehydrogenase
MTHVAVLLGHHIGYSASPAMHNAAFAACGMDARYELADIDAAELPAAVERLREPGSMGANVTRPHKLAACDLVDALAPEVERLGAANTIVRDGSRLVARNTDLDAIRAEIGALARLRRGRFERALVLGAGGAAKAVLAALDDLGCEVVTTITRASWGELAQHIGQVDLLVNATPVGTGSPESPVPAALLRPDLAVLDLVYRPSPTRLVRDACVAGGVARDGAGMLLRQAAASFELWTGRQAPLELMRDALRGELGIASDV